MLEIHNSGGAGFVFSGPHDSIIGKLIVSNTNGKGVHIFATKLHNGACDVDFIHSYGTNDIATDIEAKIKARFLQGDTAKHCGVRIGKDNLSFVEAIESFKTRRSSTKRSIPDYAVQINGSEAQIGLIRCRADSATHGVYIGGHGNIITSLHCDCAQKNFFKNSNINFKAVPLFLEVNQNSIMNYRCINHSTSPIKTSSDRIINRTRITGSCSSRNFSGDLVDGLGFDRTSKIDLIKS